MSTNGEYDGTRKWTKEWKEKKVERTLWLSRVEMKASDVFERLSVDCTASV